MIPIDPLKALSDQTFCRVAGARLSGGNRVRLLIDGPETFGAWLDAIGAATRYVDLENYILQTDATGARFVDALLAAAARGVKCRVLYDWLGCLTRSKASQWKRLALGGVEVCRYNPLQLTNPMHVISRDHRKVLCVDGDVAFTGGLCIGHDWMGDAARGIPPWRDTAIELRGPVVADIQAAFEDSWAAAHHHTAPVHCGAHHMGVGDGHGDDGVTVSVIAGRPGAMGLYRLEELVAEVAQRSLWLTDGYFVATTAYVRALTGAAKAGVDVRLLVPGSSNWPVVGALSKTSYRPLLDAGVRIFEWNGPMVHAKTAVVDGCWTRIGSSNSNLASWITNRELDVTIEDGELAAQMEAAFERDITNATEVVIADSRTWAGKPMAVSGAVSGAVPGKQARGDDDSTGKRLLSGALAVGNTLGATFFYRRALRPAESFVVLGGAIALLLLGLALIVFPRMFAWGLAVMAIWGGVDLAVRAYRLWRTGSAEQTG